MAKATRLAAVHPDNRWRTLSPLSRQSRRIKLPPRSLAKLRKATTRSLLKNVTLNWNILPRNAWRKQR